MGNLVGEHGGQFIFGCQKRVQPARHHDDAAGKGHGVDRRRIQDGEAPLHILALDLPGQIAADQIDIGLDRRIVPGRRGAEHRRGNRLAGAGFVIRALAAGQILDLAQDAAEAGGQWAVFT